MNKENILEFLAQHRDEMGSRYGVTQIGLFGSYARDEAREDSDVDIAVEIESGKKHLKIFLA